MGAVFFVILMLILALFGLFLLFIISLPLLIVGIVRGKKKKKRWPFFLASGILAGFALPMVLAFPIFVTVAGSIYNRYNPMVGERIYQEDNKEFDFKGERYTPLPYYYSGDKETDSPVVATAVNHFLWMEMSGDPFYE